MRKIRIAINNLDRQTFNNDFIILIDCKWLLLSCTNTDGKVSLSDGAIFKIAISIIDARESGFSPFGGINILIKPMGGTAIVKIPEEISNLVKEKPVNPINEIPKDGWEIVDIAEYVPAIAETKIETSKGQYLVRLKVEPSMASRNLNYKNELGEPVYLINLATLVSWKPVS